MLSTQNLNDLPGCRELKSICKAISVLDAILSPEWDYRYYSYNCKWGESEEFFEMRNGCGDHMLILFSNDGCVINGLNHELLETEKSDLTFNLPDIFQGFIYGEPVTSIGTSFCLWKIESQKWQVGKIGNYEDGSADMLHIFDGMPNTYVEWAEDYFEGSYKIGGVSLETVAKIYRGECLTRELVLSIVDSVDDWNELGRNLKEINYQYDF